MPARHPVAFKHQAQVNEPPFFHGKIERHGGNGFVAAQALREEAKIGANARLALKAQLAAERARNDQLEQRVRHSHSSPQVDNAAQPHVRFDCLYDGPYDARWALPSKLHSGASSRVEVGGHHPTADRCRAAQMLRWSEEEERAQQQLREVVSRAKQDVLPSPKSEAGFLFVEGEEPMALGDDVDATADADVADSAATVVVDVDAEAVDAAETVEPAAEPAGEVAAAPVAEIAGSAPSGADEGTLALTCAFLSNETLITPSGNAPRCRAVAQREADDDTVRSVVRQPRPRRWRRRRRRRWGSSLRGRSQSLGPLRWRTSPQLWSLWETSWTRWARCSAGRKPNHRTSGGRRRSSEVWSCARRAGVQPAVVWGG